MDCVICRGDLRSLKKLKQHEVGNKHRENVFHLLLANYLNAADDQTLEIQNTSTFSCTLCSKTFPEYSDFKSHVKEEKHANNNRMDMDDIKPGASDSNSTGKQSTLLCFCKLCCIRCSDMLSYTQHMNGQTHRRIEQLFHNLFNNVEGNRFKLKIADSRPFYCNLCALRCHDSKSYETHLAGKIHKGFEYILCQLLGEIKKEDFLDEKECGHFGDFIPPQFFCKLCNAGCSNLENYNLHLNGKNHKNKEEYITRMINNEGITACYFDERVFNFLQPISSPCICKLCDISFQKYGGYEKHMKSQMHQENKVLRGCVLGIREGKRCYRCEVIRVIVSVLKFEISQF